MYSSPLFGGCKYTNYFLFINKNIEIQCFGLLITPGLLLTLEYPSVHRISLLTPYLRTEAPKRGKQRAPIRKKPHK